METKRANAAPSGRADVADYLNDVDYLIPERRPVPGRARACWCIELASALVFTAFVVLAIAFGAFPQENFNFFGGEAVTLTEGFSIKDTGEAITIPRASDPRYTQGITIVGTMPRTVTDKDYLQITLAHQDCQVVVNGREVYNYDYTREREANASPFSSQATFVALIPLRSSDAGKPIQITYKGEFPEYASNIGVLRMGTYGELLGTMLRKSAWGVIFAFASLILGVFMTATGAIMAVRHRQKALFNIGAFAVCVSLWVLSESAMRQVYLADLSGAYYLTMISLSICYAPMLLFLNDMQQNRYYRLYYGMAAANVAIAVVLFALQFTHTVNYQYTLPVMWAEMLATIAALAGTVINDRLRNHPTYLGGVFAAGIIVLVVAGVFETARTAANLNNSRGLATGLGLFLFLVSLGYTALRALAAQMRAQQDEVRQSEEKTRKMGIQLATTLVNAVDAKDPYTNGHSNRVAMYAREIARRDGKDEAYQDRIFYMGIVHDIGKIGIPDSILQKPGRLTDEEFAVIKTHPQVGADILSDATEMPWIVTGAHWHHERYDGRGYPDGLAGEDIPEEARIIAVADAYDAMTSDRAYRGRMPQAKVRSIVEGERGTQFDPHFADIMVEMIDDDPDYRLAGSTGSDLLGIVSLSLLLDVGTTSEGAFRTDGDSFKQIYQFLRKYARRNGTCVQLVLLTLRRREGAAALGGGAAGLGDPAAGPGEGAAAPADPAAQLADAIKDAIRQSDIMAKLNGSQFMLILTDASTLGAETAMGRIAGRFDPTGQGPYALDWEVHDIEG